MENAAQLRELLRRALHLQQRQHLGVAVLLHHVYAVASIDELPTSGVNGYARSRRYDVSIPASATS